MNTQSTGHDEASKPQPAPMVEPTKEPDTVLDDFEARSAWFHAQKMIGLLATDLDRIMRKVVRAIDERLDTRITPRGAKTRRPNS